MKNIEIKLKLDSLDGVEKTLEILPCAHHEGILNQIDTYYICNGSKRLKLREINKSENVLIFYNRANDKKSKLSKYYILNIPKFCLPITKFLLRLLLGVRVVVDKKRDLWIYEHTRIHLDNVNKLGNFLELETVVGESMENSRKEYKDIFEKLSLFNYEVSSHSYSDYAILGNIK